MKKRTCEECIKYLVDMHAFKILMYLLGNPKTREDITKDLKEIPQAAIYRKIKKLEESGFVRKVILAHKKPMAKHNIVYKVMPKKMDIPNIVKINIRLKRNHNELILSYAIEKERE